MPDRYVILVIIDGARYTETLGDTSGIYTPNFKRLSAEGVVADYFYNNGRTVTNRGVPAIWSGSWSTPQDTIINGVSTQYATVPTLWEYFRKEHAQDSTQALYIMKYLSSPWLQSYRPDYGPAYWPWYRLGGSSDLQVWNNARAQLLTWHPRLSVIYFADVDSYAHNGDWAGYTNAISVADSIMGMLWELVSNDPVFRDKTTIFVTNDHGRHTDGVSTGFVGHGDGCEGCRHIMMFGIGAGLKKGVHTSVVRNIPDIVPTIGALMNFPTPVVSGTVMTEFFETSTGIKDDKGLNNNGGSGGDGSTGGNSGNSGSGFSGGNGAGNGNGNQNSNGSPSDFSLDQNYPNPFNPQTTISFSIPETGRVVLTVFNLIGQKVADLLDEELSAGRHKLVFDPGSTSRNISGCTSGVYFLRLVSGKNAATIKMVLLR
jgi:Metalloenzyme superfamily.